MTVPNFARWFPLAALATRKAGSLTSDELKGVAIALAGEQAEGLLPLLETLRAESPDQNVAGILGSPAAAKIYQKLRAETEAEDSIVFCRCPACGVSFETDLKK